LKKIIRTSFRPDIYTTAEGHASLMHVNDANEAVKAERQTGRE
jgi:hypothetical protein